MIVSAFPFKGDLALICWLSLEDIPAWQGHTNNDHKKPTTGAPLKILDLENGRFYVSMSSIIWSQTFPHNVFINHHLVLVARISLTLSRHSSLSFIALGRSSGQHPVSSHNCWMYVRAGRPAFARPCVGIHKSTYLMSSSPLLQQCPACLVRLTWIVFVIGVRWPYSWCLVGCCCQDLFRIARSILV